ncbi:MAG: ABC transporter substrate-binding protein [Candidatus Nucleicultricaceae bacterium]
MKGFKIAITFVASLLASNWTETYGSASNTREKITISGGYTGPIKDYFEDVLKGFNDAQTQYEAIFVGKGDYTKAFDATREVVQKDPATTLSDIYMLPEFGVGEISLLLNKQDGFVPIEDLIPALRDREYLAHANLLLTKDGKLYAYPNIAVGIVRYNLDLLERAKKQDPTLAHIIPEELKTWDEIFSVAERVSTLLNKDSPHPVYGITFPWTFAYTVEHTFSMAGKPITSNQNGFDGPLEARFDLAHSKPAVDLFQKLYLLFQKRVFEYVGDQSNDADALFAKGQCFILMDGANREPVIESMMKKKGSNFKLAYGPLPQSTELLGEALPSAPKTGGTGLWITRNSDGIKAFLNYVTRPDVQASWSLKTGYLPPDTLTLNEYEKQLAAQPLTPNREKAIKAALSQVKNRPSSQLTHVLVPAYGEIRGALFNQMFDMFLKGGPIKHRGIMMQDSAEQEQAIKGYTEKFLGAFDLAANQRIIKFQQDLEEKA